MSIFSKLGALIFAPTDAAGNPRQVNNHDAQVWSTEVERIIQVALEGGDLLVYGSLSALNVDLDHPAHTGAILIGESIADDGLYMKQGASGSGSWVKIGNVPGQGFVKATNAGAGTANAIAATTPVAVNETQLILLPITAANTASPVTVAFNGGAALTVKTVSGNDVAAGGLPAGSVMLGVVQGGDFRLLSDQASAGIQAAAEAAQVAAEAALAEMREKSVGGFPDNASAEAFLTAEGLTKQKGTIYFNTTADVWRYWDGSAWQTFPYAIVADGGVTEEKLADEALALIHGPKTPKTEKWLLTADWQARRDEPVDIATQRAMMEEIEAYHSDADYGVIAGDLIDTASEPSTGAAPAYGYPELFADMDSRIPSIPRSRWFMLPGNHDRDGSGGGSWRDAWTYKTYREMVGKEFYFIRKGNVVQIFMGDMQGGVGGEIPDFVVEWLRRVLSAHRTCNVIIWMHQPLNGAHPTGGSETSSWVQDRGQRIRDILDSVDNVLFVGYGHVGNTLADCLHYSTMNGTTHINFQMGIPTAAVLSRDLPYSLMELEDGTDTVVVRRWNASTHQFIAGEDINLTAKYPVKLGGAFHEYDGRHMVDPYLAVSRGEHVIYESMAEYRTSAAPFEMPLGPAWLQKIILGDDANDNAMAGHGVGTAFYVPGAATTTGDQGSTIIGPSYGLGGGVAYTRLSEAERDYTSKFQAWLRSYNADPDVVDLEVGFECLPSTETYPGLNLLVGSLRVGGFTNNLYPPTGTAKGVQLGSFEGRIVASADAVAAQFQNAADAQLVQFYQGTSLVGNIATHATGINVSETSDALLKDDEGELTFEQARAILDQIIFHRFRWNELSGDPGRLDEGVFAQELYKVYPKAVTVGYWMDKKTAKLAQEGDEGAIYVPWSVDYSKLVTVIGRCVQGTMARQDAFEQRLSSLEV